VVGRPSGKRQADLAPPCGIEYDTIVASAQEFLEKIGEEL